MDSTHPHIRAYQPTDLLGVLDLLKSNTPEYFDPSEEAALAHYLIHEVEAYFVVEQDGIILGAGGINYF